MSVDARVKIQSAWKGNHPSLFYKSPNYLNTIGDTFKKDADDQTLG